MVASITRADDVVTTQAYPRYAQNPPRLSIEGRKTWAPGKSIEQFFKTRLGIAPRDYTAMVERLCESAVEIGREFIEAARNESRWRPLAKQMTQVWSDGMASLRSVKSEPRFKGLTPAIAAAGFSDPIPPESPPTIGLSELLARPRKPKKRERLR